MPFARKAWRLGYGNEPLPSLSLKDLAGIDVPLGVYCDHVQPEELAAVLTHASHLAQDLTVIAIQEPDMVVRKVGDVQEPLLLVGRKHHAAGRSANAGIRSDDKLLQVFSLLGGDM